jgi:NTP pyrophosphatase (non-canonical NTP hydrolase)
MLKKIQEEQKPWVKHNFGDRPTWMPLLGIMEELGELAHSFLKDAQGIRMSENHDAGMKDAVADIVIFLCDFCSGQGYDLESLVINTWAEVKKRDWKADPDRAHKPENNGTPFDEWVDPSKRSCPHCDGSDNNLRTCPICEPVSGEGRKPWMIAEDILDGKKP